MKSFTLLLTLAFFGQITFAQIPADSLPNYKKIPTVPPFKIMLVPDSSAFTKDDLQKKKQTLILLFSPDCEHCVRVTKNLLAHYDLYKKVQIIMVTSLSFDHIQKFYKEHKIADYPNIKMGIDNSYFLGSFYGLRSYPSGYLYTKKGKFRGAFEGEAKCKEIEKSL